MGARHDLVGLVRKLLSESGFAVSERYTVRPISFDMIARRDNLLLVLKVLGNADALNERVAQELRILAKFLHATPLLVAERTGGGMLEDGVVYSHRGVRVLTSGTLRDHLMENAPPLAFASPGGLYVHLRSEILRNLRAQRALSLGLLAQVAGVSRRAIQMYEEGMRATIDSALRLEEYLKASIVEPIDPFKPLKELIEEEGPNEPAKLLGQFEAAVMEMLRSVGFRVVPTQQSPFNALTQKPEATILTGVERRDPQDSERARLLTSVRAVTETQSMYVVNRDTERTNVHGTPVVQRSELEKLRDPQDLVRLLKERRKKDPA
ncbi:MAG TPA: transcriptional regulator [Candidatus Thermoplasmatota archaeon]|nr:transcriptional regulator [Candidatus Thermoplasmatota archaeon]